jgi:ribosomal 50S subunit-associated protein YjgA (DUF615 family)
MIKCYVRQTQPGNFNKIKKRQCRFIGHMIRGEGMEKLVTTGKIPVKRDTR